MKFYRGNPSWLQSLVALLLCAGLLCGIGSPVAAQSPDSQQKIISPSASANSSGVVLEWRSTVDATNLGFNVYRISDGARLRINREVIPGGVFVANPRTQSMSRSYSWVDRDGRANSAYSIEAVAVNGDVQSASQTLSVKGVARIEPDAPSTPRDDSAMLQKSFPAAEQSVGATANGLLEDWWPIAAQPGLKIAVKKDGWYRVTQAEMANAGFNPSVDIRNLRLFSDGKELAINTSQSSGPFGSSDYIEFYGRGVDIPTTDTRFYYLIADTIAGKRVGGALHPDELAPGIAPPTQHADVVPPAANRFDLVWRFIYPSRSRQYFPPDVCRMFSPNAAVIESSSSQPAPSTDAANNTSDQVPPLTPESPVHLTPATLRVQPAPLNKSDEPSPASATLKIGNQKVRAKRAKRRKQNLRRHNHAVLAGAIVPSTFDTTVDVKERFIYYVNALNGDAENFFGRLINGSNVNETINTPNPDISGGGTAKLEIALQGVSPVTHEMNISINNFALGTMGYVGQEHRVQTFDVPASVLHDGANTLTFSPVPGGQVSLVDYARITYPHTWRADGNNLKFSLRGTQSVTIDGFSNSNVTLIDYTDPFSVSLSKPFTQASANGFSATIPTNNQSKKDQRLLLATISGQFQQASSLTLNQPSTINSGHLSATITNGADFLIIAHKSLKSTAAPLITARQAQGFTAGVVDVEDVYDEFGYGGHGPQAVKDFLSYAATHWTIKPRYVILLGDASYDYRNYLGWGDFDFVPTKLVDATFNETATDDWLTDFNNDGIADIPLGRLPMQTVSDANLVISKIINFAPVAPQAALLVADDPGTPPEWDFETASDDVQSLLPVSMTVQRVNLRTETSITDARQHIIDGFSQGRAVVNYSGHGNADVWSGTSVFTSTNALALTNGSKLPFVIVMDCLNGYFHEPSPGLVSLSEAFLRAPNGGAVAVFASSGLTSTPGQRPMELELYRQLYGAQSIAVGDAIRIAKNASSDIDVRRTWIYFGDPSLKIR